MQNRLVFIDFETDNEQGYGLQIWSKRFKVSSCGFLTDTGDKKFSVDFNEIGDIINFFHKEGYTFCVYNASFDCTILMHIFGLADAFSRSIDVWRLAGYCNMTVDEDSAKKRERDVSLVGSVKYYYGEPDFKEKHLQYLIDNGTARNLKEAHKKVAMLPPDLLEAYNLEDVYQTKRIYDHTTALLAQWEIDWTTDHSLYMHESYLYAKSFIYGIRIDRETLFLNVASLKTNIETIHSELMQEPSVVEAESRLVVRKEKVTHPMIKKHKLQFPEKWHMQEPTQQEVMDDMVERISFNFNSCLHKKLLFIDILGYPVIRYTDGGKPEISKVTLPEYGEIGGKLLKMLKMQKELKQLEVIEAMSEEDGRLHPSLRSSTTVSSRSSSTMS